MSVSQANSSVTSEVPAREREVTRRSPGTTPTSSSRGRVTKVSTSIGAAPGSRVSTVSVGYEISGSRFTGSRPSDTRPKTQAATVNMATLTGRRMQAAIREFTESSPGAAPAAGFVR